MMNRVIIFLMCIVSISLAKGNKDLVVYSSVGGSSVKLKWIPNRYFSTNRYKLYKSCDGKKEKLIKTVRPVSLKKLKKQGYSKDYIFMVYPFENTKNINDQILAQKAENTAGGFRVLKLLEDNNFAKNLGQFYVDTDIKNFKVCRYKLELYRAGKLKAKAKIKVNISQKGVKNTIFWVQARGFKWGVGLKWSTGGKSGFYNIYRKMENDKEFEKMNSSPFYISKSFSKNSEIFYKDKSLGKNQKASYYIRRVDFFGQEGEPSRTVSAKILINKKPTIVQNIFIKSNDKSITIRWRELNDVLGYNLYRSTNYKGGFKKLNKKIIKKEIYIDKSFRANQNYYYYITSVNLFGESAPSMRYLAYARDVTPPKTPKELKFSVGAGVVKLKWKGVDDKDLLGYRVYMSMDKNAQDWGMINKKFIKNSNYIHKREKTLSRFAYYYKVTAVDKNYNESPFSNIIKVKLPDVTAPREPAIVKLIVYPNRVHIKWESIILYDLDHYNVYRKEGKRLVRLNKQPIYTNVFEDKNPPKAKRLIYAVSAVDKSGNESKKSKFLKSRMIDTKAVEIKNFNLKKIKDGIKIFFESSSDDYSGFEVYKSNGSDLNYYNISGFKTGKSFIDKVVTKNQKYFYMIKAYDKSGNISESRVLEIRLK